METLSSSLQPFSEWLLRATLQASLLICLILVIQLVLGTKLGIRSRYCLWLVLLLRMALPWSPQSRLSIFNVIPQRGQPAPMEYARQEVGAIPVSSAPAGAGTSESTVVSTTEVTEDGPQATTGTAGVHQEAERHLNGASYQIADALPLIWLIGALILAVYVFSGNFSLWRIVKRERLLIDQWILELLEDCKSQMRVRTVIGLVVTDKVGTPALFGFVRPRLLLPRSFIEALDREELRHVFLHELAHLRRHDIFVGYLVSVLQTLHWFNPLVWLAFNRLRADRELACDGLALSTMNTGESTKYGRTVVHLLENFLHRRRLPSLAGISEDKSQIKRRITMIAKFKKGSYRFSAMAAVLLIVLSVVVLTNAEGTSGKTEQKKSLAESFVEMLVNEKFEEAAENFDDKMKKAFPPTRLAEVWKATTGQAGPFKQKLGIRAEKMLWTDIIYVTCRFKEDPIDVKVIYNRNNKVSGLWFVPVPQSVLEKYAVPSQSANSNTSRKGPQWTSVTNEPGPKGYALKFNGAGDFVRVPNHPSLEPKSEITIEMWAWIDGPQTIYTRLLRKTGHGNSGYLLAADQGDRRMQIRLDSGRRTIRAADNVVHTERAGKWHHFAGVYGIDHVSFYVDGQLVNTQKHDQKDLMHSNIDLYIGHGAPGGSSEYFKGMIDEVRIWNVARTEQQIKTNMNRSVAADSSGLAAYWNFDEGKGNIAHDSTRNQNHGTLENHAIKSPIQFKNRSFRPDGNTEVESKIAAKVANLPGKLVFHGRYQHRSRGRDIETPGELWLKQDAEGSLKALAYLPWMGTCDLASGDAGHQLTSYRSQRESTSGRPAYNVDLDFKDGKALLDRQGVRENVTDKQLKIPNDARFSPNSRPDSYCAANIFLRSLNLTPGQSREFTVYDWDNSGEALVDYTIQVSHAGKERITVFAGTFEANHLVLKQLTSADTWFKKRAGHVTDFWVLDNHVIVRVLRQREPYEIVLLDYTCADN